MTEEAKAARRAYWREWRKKHPDKVREYQRRHWEKVASIAKRMNDGGKQE